jgi:hypothetical protein
MHPLTTRPIRVLVLLAAAAAASCSTTDLFAPTPPAAAVTETYAGTLMRNGAATYSFTISSIAQTTGVTATLSSVAPDNTVPIGLSLGTWNGASCQIVLTNDRAFVGSTIVGSVNTSGTLCLRVFDVGSLIEDPLSYEVKVVHQ